MSTNIGNKKELGRNKMKSIEVIYSSLCEATGAFIGELEEWLQDTDVQMEVIPFCELEADRKKRYGYEKENCFIDVFYKGKRIDTVPLNQQRIYAALEIEEKVSQAECVVQVKDEGVVITISEFRRAVYSGKIDFVPITKETYKEEMSMCLCNYPFGNPPQKYHKRCIDIKNRVFEEIWEKEQAAGLFARYKGKVIGLLEVIPREILKKHGFLAGNCGQDEEYLTIGCYEVGFGVPRKEMLDELMYQLEQIYGVFSRKFLEAIGTYEWNEGFCPYWVYDKYDFRRQAQINENTVIMEKKLKV